MTDTVAPAPGAPAYVAHRMAVWDAAVERRMDKNDKDEKIIVSSEHDPQHPAASAHPNTIRVSLPDGAVRDAVAGVTTPMDIAMAISESLGRRALVAVVDGHIHWDMSRPLLHHCQLRICDFDTPEGKATLWHSTAHMLGEAMEYKYAGELCIGPPLEDGFYYDMHIHGDRKVTEADFDDLAKRVDKIAKEKRTFHRLELTKQEAKDMFSYNPFKLEIIEELDEHATITAYRDGPFIDLCRGPHVPQSTRMKAMMCKGTGQAYWRGKSENPSLQRVYGISFPDKKLLKEYKDMLAEAAKRDHRVLGPKQELIMFHPLSPGCPFLLPHGQRVFNTLQQFLRKEYWKRGYQEVQTPNLFDFDLWHTSGHAANYRDNMFQLMVEGREYGLKPMNCPSHCLIFASRVRSHRELPMRLADFGVLHRNELSGSLGGLTRVRRFQQDDAHIFCLAEQVSKEVYDFLQFLKYVYDIFGFSYELDLSTRPEKFLGEIKQWDIAEQMLTTALVQFTGKQCGELGGWNLNPGDGAFYGPKIDIKVFDALKRRHQCATLQLDFQLPVRFNLQVQSKAPQSSHSEEPKSDSSAPNPDHGQNHHDVKADRGDILNGMNDAVSNGTETSVRHETGGTNTVLSAKGDSDRNPDEDGKSVRVNTRKDERVEKPCNDNEDNTETDVHRLKLGFERPVIIHRALYGSFERFFAILIEHFGGYWPFWLSPRQAIVVPISEKYLDYAHEVQANLKQEEFFVDVDTSDRTIGKKMAEARNNYYNVILVVGEQEVTSKSVNMRVRGSDESTSYAVTEVLEMFIEWRANMK